MKSARQSTSVWPASVEWAAAPKNRSKHRNEHRTVTMERK
jgi:hypothetical protein